MKAIELPINALIIIVLAVIVLIAVIALFYTGIIGPREAVSAQTALNNACMKLLTYNCNSETKTIAVNNFDADKDGTVGDVGIWTWGDACNPSPAADGDNLASLCACYYQINSETECKNLCNC